MGTFHVQCTIQNPVDRTKTVTVSKILVDSGGEYTWVSEETLERLGIPREKQVSFVMANGKHIARRVGFAIVKAEDCFTIDEVVFAKKGDLQLLGARSLGGLNLTVDSRRKKLVAGGPLPAARA